MASHLNQPHFQDEIKAREFLERSRWPNGPICVHCGAVDRISKLEGKAHRPGLYFCGHCRQQFTVTVGTLFERSKIKLNVWLQAAYFLCSSKKGMSSHQLHRMLGVTYKTAWFMTHRIREAMKTSHSGLLGSGGGTVEADETFWGNNKKVKASPGRGYHHKMKVFALVERNGKARGFHVADVTAKTLSSALRANVAKEAKLMTDEASMYTLVGREFASHEVVAHSAKEYARGHIHTNTIEGYFSLLKRGLIGTYHHVGSQHLQRYVNEFDFRYNNREVTDAERTANAIRGISGKRLLYKGPNG